MSISDLLLLEFDAEAKTTRTMLERVPEDKKDFTPHPKSMPLNKLAPHVAELAGFGVTVLTTPELDFSKGSRQRVAFESANQLVRVFDEGAAKVRAAHEGYARCGMDRELEAELSGQAYLQRIAFSGLPANVSESPGAPPRTAWRLSASQRQAAACHLRAVSRRHDGFLRKTTSRMTSFSK